MKLGIVNYGKDRFEVLGDHRKVAVFYRLEEAEGYVALVQHIQMLTSEVQALARRLEAAEALATAAELSILDGYNLLYAAADELQRAGYMERARRLRQKANKEREALRQWREVSQ